MGSCISSVHKLGDGENSYSMICFDGTDFWILNDCGDLFTIWNKYRGIIDRVNLTYAGRFHHIFCVGDAIWRIPCNGNLTCDVIYKNNRKVNNPIQLQVKENEQRSVNRFFKTNDAALCIKKQNESIFVYSTQRDSCLLYTSRCV